ncbi:MAG: phosphoenolpyruvate--protein phosphotransferase [Spirochaetia bacterium]
MKKDNVDLICSIAELAGMFEKQTTLRGFLQEVVEMLSKHMRSEACSIFLYDNEAEKLILEATKGLDQSTIGEFTLDYGEGITGKALKELRPILESVSKENPSFKYVPEIKEDKYHAFLAVPIIRGLTRVGVIVLQHSQKGYFTDHDAKAMRAIASQLAATLENAKLLMELHQREKHKEKPSHAAQMPTRISGRGEANGIAIGKAVVLGKRYGDFLIADEHTEYKDGTAAFDQAIVKSRLQLEELQEQIDSDLSDIASLIFSTHLLMLKDDGFSGEMRNRIESGEKAYKAIIDVVNEYVHVLSHVDNPRIKEKAQDVKDLGHRLLRNLQIDEIKDGDYSGQIVVAQDLLPSEMIKILAQHAEGILLFGGGATAHVSILAKSLSIPFIMTEDPAFFHIQSEMDLILDSRQNNIFIEPDAKIITQFENIIEAEKSLCLEEADTESETYTEDGIRINILANINLLSDLSSAKQTHAEGVGLYRSEFPFLVRNDFPSEEEQLKVYKKIYDESKNKEVTLRTLDIGGDKFLSYMSANQESNPFLGLRAIRFSLKNKNIFSQQLRAMLRAGAGTELRILFPLISSLDDFLEAKEVVFDSIALLGMEGITHNSAPKLGAMIELPSAVEVAEDLAKEADFLSIGTNDLIQYFLGVDRTNEQVSGMYLAHHPAIYRALYRFAQTALPITQDISVCGNIAADPYMLAFFIGIGIKKFSVDPKVLPSVQRAIQKINSLEAAGLSKRLMAARRLEDVQSVLEQLTDLQKGKVHG